MVYITLSLSCEGLVENRDLYLTKRLSDPGLHKVSRASLSAPAGLHLVSLVAGIFIKSPGRAFTRSPMLQGAS